MLVQNWTPQQHICCLQALKLCWKLNSNIISYLCCHVDYVTMCGFYTQQLLIFVGGFVRDVPKNHLNK